MTRENIEETDMDPIQALYYRYYVLVAVPALKKFTDEYEDPLATDERTQETYEALVVASDALFDMIVSVGQQGVDINALEQRFVNCTDLITKLRGEMAVDIATSVPHSPQLSLGRAYNKRRFSGDLQQVSDDAMRVVDAEDDSDSSENEGEASDEDDDNDRYGAALDYMSTSTSDDSLNDRDMSEASDDIQAVAGELGSLNMYYLGSRDSIARAANRFVDGTLTEVVPGIKMESFELMTMKAMVVCLRPSQVDLIERSLASGASVVFGRQFTIDKLIRNVAMSKRFGQPKKSHPEEVSQEVERPEEASQEVERSGEAMKKQIQSVLEAFSQTAEARSLWKAPRSFDVVKPAGNDDSIEQLFERLAVIKNQGADTATGKMERRVTKPAKQQQQEEQRILGYDQGVDPQTAKNLEVIKNYQKNLAQQAREGGV
jgi:hypothetical protein